VLNVLLVGAGGFFGASSRYLVSGLVEKLFTGVFPAGTLAVNVIGSFIAGFALEFGLFSGGMPPRMRLALVTGFLGGFTTFSTFSWETAALLGDRGWLFGALNIVLNILLCLTGVWLGKTLAHFLYGGVL